MQTPPKTDAPTVVRLSDEEFRKSILDLVGRELGAGGLARFIRMFCSGPGDYTAERHQWLDRLTLEEIERQVSAESQRQQAREG